MNFHISCILLAISTKMCIILTTSGPVWVPFLTEFFEHVVGLCFSRTLEHMEISSAGDIKIISGASEKIQNKIFLYQLHCSDCFNFSVLYFWCSCICVVCCVCFTKDPRYILYRVVSFSCKIIVFIYVPLRECVPRSHFSRFLWERITCWNSF